MSNADPPAGPTESPRAGPVVGQTRERILAWMEFGFIVAFAIWAAIGMIHYMLRSRGTLEGLLTMLDTRWKGISILAALLFFRTLQPSLMRMKFKTPVGEVDMSEIAVLPAASYDNPASPPEPHDERERAP